LRSLCCRKVFSADYVCNPDFNISQLGLVTRWIPVKNLTFSAEVQWVHLDQKFTGAATLAAAAPEANGGVRIQGSGRGFAAGSRPAQFLICRQHSDKNRCSP